MIRFMFCLVWQNNPRRFVMVKGAEMPMTRLQKREERFKPWLKRLQFFGLSQAMDMLWASIKNRHICLTGALATAIKQNISEVDIENPAYRT